MISFFLSYRHHRSGSAPLTNSRSLHAADFAPRAPVHDDGAGGAQAPVQLQVAGRRGGLPLSTGFLGPSGYGLRKATKLQLTFSR